MSAPQGDTEVVIVTKETTGSKDRYNETSYIDGFTRETALVNACKSGDLARVKELLAMGISINCLDVNSHTPLIGATYKGHPEIVSYLLEAKANPNQSERYSGGTAAHKAASYGATKILGLLIQAGADVNATERPPSRATPLHAAVRAGHLACCEVLVRAKASPYTENDNGDTPLSWAEEAERDDMVELFLTVPPPEDTPRKSSGFFGCCD